MEPLLSIQIYNDPPVYRPGDRMRFDFQVDAIEAAELTAVESSIVWTTEGKGDEDMGVHFFERRVPSESEQDLRSLRTCHVKLPNSPLSYQGEILQVCWSARVRIFVRGGAEFCAEKAFVLSTTAPIKAARVLPNEC